MVGRRIVVVGTTGAGKTALARHLAEVLELPHIELDAFYWGPNWQAAEIEGFRRKVSAALAANAWVADGNYRQVRDIVWGRADTLIWLDYSLPRIFARLTRRTAYRMLRGIELWSGNRERLDQVFSRDSLYLWALQTHGRRRREYPEQLERPEYRHLQWVRLQTPRETRCWLRQSV